MHYSFTRTYFMTIKTEKMQGEEEEEIYTYPIGLHTDPLWPLLRPTRVIVYVPTAKPSRG